MALVNAKTRACRMSHFKPKVFPASQVTKDLFHKSPLVACATGEP